MVMMVLKVKKERLALKVGQAQQDLQVIKDLQAHLVQKDKKDKQVIQAQPDLLDQMDLMGTRDKKGK